MMEVLPAAMEAIAVQYLLLLLFGCCFYGHWQQSWCLEEACADAVAVEHSWLSRRAAVHCRSFEQQTAGVVVVVAPWKRILLQRPRDEVRRVRRCMHVKAPYVVADDALVDETKMMTADDEDDDRY